jgi:GT2 family glycosyltransferase
MDASQVCIVIPTRGRAAYLEAALASVAPQARAAGAELIVVNDGPDAAIGPLVARHGGRSVPLPGPRGANAARNAGIAASRAELFVLLDDDVRAPAGWLDALLEGARRSPGVDVFGGPIRAVLEGGGPRGCGRENPPITSLDLGPRDRDVELVWSANMAIRRRALERVGPFDESIHGRGEEEDWERRHRAAGGAVRYLAGAGLEHRRCGADASLRRLARAAYALGMTARRYDVRKGSAPAAGRELRTLAATIGHVVRRRCPLGLVSVAHSLGRVRALAGGAGG